MSKPGIAAVLSFIVPGLGQLYNGAFTRALFWFVLTIGLHIGTAGLGGWICHFLCAYTAYTFADRQQRGQLPR